MNTGAGGGIGGVSMANGAVVSQMDGYEKTSGGKWAGYGGVATVNLAF